MSEANGQDTVRCHTRVFNDPIHGLIELPPLCNLIVDTPQYQRLRHIKQLGAAYYVYPGAGHNRFEHGIGVCHLAGQMVKQLKDNAKSMPQVYDSITDLDILCIQIAGLCHDLGHGPFSHAFEHYFVHVPERKDWSHEKASLKMLDSIVATNETAFNDEFGGVDKRTKYVNFIKRLISEDADAVDESLFGGKEFLFEIVANKENGIDVDKFDYFARDCHYLGYKNSFQANRLMKFARVIDVGGRKHICYPDKEVENIYDLFYQRTLHHHRTCQHKTVKIIEIMYMEALLMADTLGLVDAGQPKGERLCNHISDMTVYANLTDCVFEMIRRLYPTSEPAKLLERVTNRDHYKLVGEAMPKMHQKGLDVNWKLEDGFADEIAKMSSQDTDEWKLSKDDIRVNIVTFDYGCKRDKSSDLTENPLNNVYFYNKADPSYAKILPREEVSYMLPAVFFEQHIRVYVTCSKEEEPKRTVKTEKAKKAFRDWCRDKNFTIIKDFDRSCSTSTATDPAGSVGTVKDSTG